MNEQMKRLKHIVICIGTVIAISALSLGYVTPAAQAADYPFSPVTTTTGSCPAGRTCFNIKTVNSCGGTGNVCGVYNAGGGSSDFALGGASTHSNEQRAYNNNSGSYRTVCAYNNSQSQVGFAYYGGGWAAMPFTGIGNIIAIPVGWPLCGV